ncbi:MAG: peptidylprolyl isomerase [Ignavibacteria bacterium]
MILTILSILVCLHIQGNNDPEGLKQNGVVAEIDSLKITAEEFYLSYEYGPAFPKRKNDSKERYLNYMINEKLLALDGYSRKIDTTEQAVETLNEYRNDIMTEELFKQDILSKVKIERHEIDSAVSKKNIILEIKWLFAADDEKIKSYLTQLKSGISFDSLFSQQINDTVFFDNRYMKIDRDRLGIKNPALAAIADSLKAGEISLPVHTNDGWYIIKLENASEDLITTESEFEKAEQEAVSSIKKYKMDKLSDKYVNELMMQHNPVIKRDAFNFLRSYLGNLLLSKEKYSNWNLSGKLASAVNNLNNSGEENHALASLVQLIDGKFTITDFLTWYRSRSHYINLNENDLKSFSASLENLIWRMVRDRLLAQKAFERGFNNAETVIKQTNWWKDKIISSMVKNEITTSVLLGNKEVKTGNKNDSLKVSAEIDEEFNEKLLRRILSLKKNHKININKKLLGQINVSVENDPRAVEFYIVKQGTLIPRTPYPTIDKEWAKWE